MAQPAHVFVTAHVRWLHASTLISTFSIFNKIELDSTIENFAVILTGLLAIFSFACLIFKELTR